MLWTWQVGTAWYRSAKDANAVNRELVESIKTAIHAGYRHLDSAEAYENEESVGQAIVESGVPRGDIFLTTKVAAGLKATTAVEALTKQLALLQTSYVDLYLIHWPFDLGKEGFPTHEEAWKQFEEVKTKGLAKVSSVAWAGATVVVASRIGALTDAGSDGTVTVDRSVQLQA